MLAEIAFLGLYLVVMLFCFYSKKDKVISIACFFSMLGHFFLAFFVDYFSTDTTVWLYYFLAALINSILYIVAYDHCKPRDRNILIPIAILSIIPYIRSVETYLLGIDSIGSNFIFNMIYLVGIPLTHGWLLMSLINHVNRNRPKDVADNITGSNLLSQWLITHRTGSCTDYNNTPYNKNT